VQMEPSQGFLGMAVVLFRYNSLVRHSVEEPHTEYKYFVHLRTCPE
jgi:hypothetical protein